MIIPQRLPKHIGIIPDGNRRWAQSKGLNKEEGYEYGLQPAYELYQECIRSGIKELTFYGFTQDNTKRPAVQTKAFQKACIDSVMRLKEHDANLLIVGNADSPLFPEELKPYTQRTTFGKGLINVNFLVNYGWNWDLNRLTGLDNNGTINVSNFIESKDVSRIDLIIRWGGRRRLSGFLPIQSVYADFFILEEMWPDFKMEHFYQALDWYSKQDITLGG